MPTRFIELLSAQTQQQVWKMMELHRAVGLHEEAEKHGLVVRSDSIHGTTTWELHRPDRKEIPPETVEQMARFLREKKLLG
ncbi:MAG: hypothetical protein V1708_03865 [Candidatus Micrarchaeota archaeon]